jgi:hypothetical protein
MWRSGRAGARSRVHPIRRPRARPRIVDRASPRAGLRQRGLRVLHAYDRRLRRIVLEGRSYRSGCSKGTVAVDSAYRLPAPSAGVARDAAKDVPSAGVARNAPKDAEHAERRRGRRRSEHVYRGRGRKGALPRARGSARPSSIGSKRDACMPRGERMTAASTTPAGGSTARRSSTATSVTDGHAKVRWSAVVPAAGAAREGSAVRDRGRGCVRMAEELLCVA